MGGGGGLFFKNLINFNSKKIPIFAQIVKATSQYIYILKNKVLVS